MKKIFKALLTLLIICLASTWSILVLLVTETIKSETLAPYFVTSVVLTLVTGAAILIVKIYED